MTGRSDQDEVEPGGAVPLTLAARGDGAADFLSGGGKVGALLRAQDWAQSPLGPPAQWPQSLRSVVGLLLNSKFPMFVAWGEKLGLVYNDSYSEILGAKHPQALGRPFRDVWSEIWPGISPLVDAAMAGEASFRDDLPLLMNRAGFDEQTWFTFSYSPVRDESGAVAGMFCACTETTREVLAKKRQAFRLAFEDRLRHVVDPLETIAAASAALGEQLGAGQVAYAEIDAGGEHGVIGRDWNDGTMASNVGIHRLEAFGSAFIADLKRGRTVAIDDVARDPRTALPAALATFEQASIAAILNVPLIKAGRLVAILGVHCADPRDWSAEDIGLVEEVAERTWFTVEAHRAEAALRESEERLRLVIDGAGDYAIFTADPDRRITSWSRGAETVFGYSADQAIGMSADVLWTPEDRASHQPEREVEIAAEQGCANDERWHQRADGGRVFLNGSVHPLPPYADGSERGVIKIARDETERRRIEGLRGLQNRVLESVVRDTPLKDALAGLVEAVEAQSPSHVVGSILLLDPDGARLRHGAAPSLPEAYNAAIDGIEIGPAVGSCGTAAHRKAAVYVADIATDPLWSDFRGLALEHGLKACWSSPILSGQGNVLGTFAMYNREAREPDATDLELVDFVTRSAALIIERKQAETALRTSEERLHFALEAAAGVGTWDWDVRSDRVVANAAFATLYGVDPARAAAGAPIEEFTANIHPEDIERVRGEIAAAMKTGEPFISEYRLVGRDGATAWVAARGRCRLDQDGRAVRFSGVTSDITQRRAMEEALRESEERFRDLAENIPTLCWWADATGYIFWYNRRWYEYTGTAPTDMAGWGWQSVHDPERLPAVMTRWQASIATGEPFEMTFPLRAADGSFRPFLTRIVPLRDERGTILRWFGTNTDIHEQRAVEAALRESEERLKRVGAEQEAILSQLAEGVIVTDAAGRIIFVNDAASRIHGVDRLDVPPEEYSETYHLFTEAGDPYPPERLPLARAVTEGVALTEERWRIRTPDGRDVAAVGSARPVFTGDGARVGSVLTLRDDSARQAAEAALSETEERYRLSARATNDAIWDWDLTRNHVLWNEALCAQYGYRTEEVAPTGDWWIEHIHPDDRERIDHSIHALIDGAGERWQDEYRFRAADGSYRSVLDRGSVIRDETGNAVRMIGAMLDQTEIRAAEQRLQELNETLEQRVVEEVEQRSAAEEALRQMQKMETLGQLTGGVAHDFNNLLQIVTGNLEILQRNLPQDQARLRRSADNAMRGAERAAVLTQRLLAFARRQPLEPKPISLNKLVGGMSELLHRTLGEAYEVETVLASGLWGVEADPNQLENAIINLAVNARDAMAGGGKLTIETSNTSLDHGYAAQNTGVTPGQYVVICVSDTGSGMDAETIERVFEPFFTTKEVGRGTGLGLSMVYGFVKQSGGHVKIYSEPGEGTTVKLYLPRRMGAVAEEEAKPDPLIPEGTREETILVCEDDDDVRTYSVEVLRELGYRVLEAHDGPSALRLLERQESDVDLLFTDVVLPSGMMGDKLAEAARAIRPGLKVLFTTGYARNAIVHHGRLDPGVELITKPFTYADLAARIRDLLDQS